MTIGSKWPGSGIEFPISFVVRRREIEEAKTRYIRGPGLDSLYGSTTVVDEFNVSNKVYKEAQLVEDYIDPSVVTAL